MTPARVQVTKDTAGFVRDLLLRAGRESISRDDGFYAALDVAEVSQALCRALRREDLPWDAVDLFVACEAHGQTLPGHQALAGNLGFPGPRLHGLHSTDDYEQLLRVTLGPTGRFDFLHLALGPNGALAGLAPNAPDWRDDPSWVLKVAVPGDTGHRSTIGAELLRRARTIVVTIQGEEAARAFLDWEATPLADHPCTIVNGASGQVHWIADEQAGHLLGRG